MQLVNCGLSDVTIKALEARGITALFPIQKHVYEPAAAGRLTCYAHHIHSIVVTHNMLTGLPVTHTISIG